VGYFGRTEVWSLAQNHSAKGLPNGSDLGRWKGRLRIAFVLWSHADGFDTLTVCAENRDSVAQGHIFDCSQDAF